uniref:Kunitz peptide n=1 Tax=Calliophis bivirgatus TaxID=8633 RepID=A0A898IND4_CALBG|nr:kunitz peptide [Calliophis bivirgatus]
MSSGSLLLLLGLLTLWAEMTPVSSKPRFNPRFCKLPSNIGSCSGNLQYFYFNRVSKRCDTFIYSGCGGNPNRFETMEECKRNCVGK